MDIDDIIADMTDRIVRRFDPAQVILFGSRARGDNRPDSDVDLLVVFDELEDKRATTVAVLRELQHAHAPKDVVVATTQELVVARDRIGSVIEPAAREGRILYRRAG